MKNADLVIGSVLIPGGSTSKLFNRKYLAEMKDGAVPRTSTIVLTNATQKYI